MQDIITSKRLHRSSLRSAHYGVREEMEKSETYNLYVVRSLYVPGLRSRSVVLSMIVVDRLCKNLLCAEGAIQADANQSCVRSAFISIHVITGTEYTFTVPLLGLSHNMYSISGADLRFPTNSYGTSYPAMYSEQTNYHVRRIS